MKRRLLGGALLVCLAACAAPPAAHPPQVPLTLGEQEARIHTLRAQFKAKVTTRDTERNAAGVLLVQKPDRFRLRMSSPFGMTVMDYLSVDRHTRLDLPMNQKVLFDDAIDAGNAFHTTDLRAAFLRGPDAYPPPCQSTESNDATLLDCGLRHLTLHGGDLATESESDEAGVRLTAAYTDIRDVGGMRMPFSIIMQYPRDGVTLEVTIVRYEINPAFSEELFRAGEWPPR